MNMQILFNEARIPFGEWPEEVRSDFLHRAEEMPVDQREHGEWRRTSDSSYKHRSIYRIHPMRLDNPQKLPWIETNNLWRAQFIALVHTATWEYMLPGLEWVQGYGYPAYDPDTPYRLVNMPRVCSDNAAELSQALQRLKSDYAATVAGLRSCKDNLQYSRNLVTEMQGKQCRLRLELQQLNEQLDKTNEQLDKVSEQLGKADILTHQRTNLKLMDALDERDARIEALESMLDLSQASAEHSMFRSKELIERIRAARNG